MSILATDDRKNVLQAFHEPVTGSTESVLTVAAASVKTAAALSSGIYRIFIPAGATLTHFASGVFGTVAASSIDLPRDAGEYFVQIKSGDGIAVFDAIGGQTISITLMP